MKLTQLVDFYNFYPVVIKRDKNASESLFLALSSGASNKVTGKIESQELNEDGQKLLKIMEFVWTKIEERFSRM